MNLRYLGDALDHWKGSLLESLQEEGLLRNLHVDAMASDKESWTATDNALFARLLRIKPEQLVRHHHRLSRDRAKYFSEIPTGGDIFFDPDTGIKTGRVKQSEHYLTPNELCDAMNRDTRRLVIVYQHVRAQRTRQRVESVLKTLGHQQTPLSCASYESATVALLFFGAEKTRVEKVRNYFTKVLGSHATGRIGHWCQP